MYGNKPSGFGLMSLIGGAVGVVAMIFLLVWLFAMHRIVTPPAFTTVLVDQPWFIGHGGVREETQSPGTGWFWATTHGVSVPSYDFKIDEIFDDLPTRMQSFIDFRSYLKLRITDPVKLVKDFRFNDADGNAWFEWYNASIREQYRTIVRNEARKHLMEDILSNPTTIIQMEANIREEMDKTIKEIGIPLVLVDLSLGRASPNQEVMDEINNTSKQQQRVKSEDARKVAEDSRLLAETARAKADNAYRNAMGLGTQQYIELEIAKEYSAACKASKDCVVVNGTSPVLIGGR